MGTLQIFNRYLEEGGEESAVVNYEQLLSQTVELDCCYFDSRDWVSPEAPPKWQMPFRAIYNPPSVRRVIALQEKYRYSCWITHNVFPVGSAGIYKAALSCSVPVVHILHNWRPFSVNGSFWIDGQVAQKTLRTTYSREIFARSWQGSALKTSILAGTFQWLSLSGWQDAIKTWVAISDFARDRFVEAGIPENRIVALRHCCEPVNKTFIQTSAAEETHYLFLGRLIEEKGIRTLINAWDLLYSLLGSSCPPLAIAGNGSLTDEVKKAASRNPSIRFLGHVSGDMKADLLGKCRAVIVPSIWWEPLGLVVYEAYDYGKPVLAARSGGLSETIVDGETGLLHNPGDGAQIAEQVMLMERDFSLRRSMGESGRRWLLENASPEEWKSKMQKIIENVCLC